jgi:hypothetical protein
MSSTWGKWRLLKQHPVNSLNHVIIKVELYRAQRGLMQSYSCQNFGHVWANCKQPLWCLWCGGGHLRREYTEKTNTESTLSCCICILVEGEEPHPASYWGCSHVKGQLQRSTAQRAPKGYSVRTFSCKFTFPQQLNAAALCQATQHQLPQAPQRYEKSLWTPVQQHLPQYEIQRTGLSVQALRLTNSDMLKIATLVQQIFTELSEAVIGK